MPGGWGRRPKGDAPRSEAGALGARPGVGTRPQPPTICHPSWPDLEPGQDSALFSGWMSPRQALRSTGQGQLALPRPILEQDRWLSPRDSRRPRETPLGNWVRFRGVRGPFLPQPLVASNLMRQAVGFVIRHFRAWPLAVRWIRNAPRSFDPMNRPPRSTGSMDPIPFKEFAPPTVPIKGARPVRATHSLMFRATVHVPAG